MKKVYFEYHIKKMHRNIDDTYSYSVSSFDAKSPPPVDKTDQDDHWYNQDYCHHWHHPHHCLLIEQILHSSKCFDFENILRSDDIEEVPDLTTTRYYLSNF